MVRVSVAKFGEVPQSSVDRVLKILNDCYRIIGEPQAELVELFIFKESEARAFFATHDALSGKPRISIYLDHLLSLPEIVSLAGLRRQAAHSVLHGSLESYLIPFPESLLQAIKQYQLPLEYAHKLLQAAAMASKEYRVTELLYEKGFVEDQAAYAKYILELGEEEILAWEIASRNKLEKILHLSSILRDISCAVPLLRNATSGEEIRESLAGKLSHLPPEYQIKIKGILSRAFPPPQPDLLRSIDLLIREISRELLGYELNTWPSED